MKAIAELVIDGQKYRFALEPLGAAQACKYKLTVSQAVPIVPLWSTDSYEWVADEQAVTKNLRKMVENIIEDDNSKQALEQAVEQIVDEFDEVERA